MRQPVEDLEQHARPDVDPRPGEHAAVRADRQVLLLVPLRGAARRRPARSAGRPTDQGPRLVAPQRRVHVAEVGRPARRSCPGSGAGRGRRPAARRPGPRTPRPPRPARPARRGSWAAGRRRGARRPAAAGRARRRPGRPGQPRRRAVRRRGSRSRSPARRAGRRSARRSRRPRPRWGGRRTPRPPPGAGGRRRRVRSSDQCPGSEESSEGGGGAGTPRPPSLTGPVCLRSCCGRARVRLALQHSTARRHEEARRGTTAAQEGPASRDRRLVGVAQPLDGPDRLHGRGPGRHGRPALHRPLHQDAVPAGRRLVRVALRPRAGQGRARAGAVADHPHLHRPQLRRDDRDHVRRLRRARGRGRRRSLGAPGPARRRDRLLRPGRWLHPRPRGRRAPDDRRRGRAARDRRQPRAAAGGRRGARVPRDRGGRLPPARPRAGRAASALGRPRRPPPRRGARRGRPRRAPARRLPQRLRARERLHGPRPAPLPLRRARRHPLRHLDVGLLASGRDRGPLAGDQARVQRRDRGAAVAPLVAALSA